MLNPDWVKHPGTRIGATGKAGRCDRGRGSLRGKHVGAKQN